MGQAKRVEKRADEARGKAAQAIAEAARESAAEVEVKAAQVAERIRGSDAVQRAQARGAEFAATARTKVDEAHLEERAAALAATARSKAAESEAAAQRAREQARRVGDERLERVGEWLAASKAGEALHVTRAPKRRGLPGVLLLVLGIAVGFAIAKLTASGKSDYEDDFAAAADRLSPPQQPLGDSPDRPPDGPPNGPSDTLSTASPAATVPGDAPATGRPLAERVRAGLDADERTRELPGLAINVAEGTVFVRGTVPAGFDQSAIRAVVGGVPGVTDVDLQVTATA